MSAARPPRIRRGPGPARPVNARPGVGFTSVSPWVYDLDAPCGRVVELLVDDTGLEGRMIGDDELLSYVVHPVFDDTEPDVRDSYAATAVALVLRLEDGRTPTGLVDQHGVIVEPVAQYASRTIAVDQWTRKALLLDEFAGARIVGVVLRVAVPRRIDGSGGSRRVLGYLDTIAISPRPPRPTEPIEWVRTTRGTASSDRFSRGNCAPLVAPPHGFVFGLPMTDGGNRGWPYSYHEADDERNIAHLQSFATSHIPSPWMGDRGVLQFFPSPRAQPSADRRERALAFSHDDEVDRPDRYAVPLGGGVAAGGLDAELTAGARSVWLRTRFPADIGSIVFDQLDGAGRLDLRAACSSREITGHVDGPGGLVSVPRTYFVARVDVPITDARHHDHPERGDVLGSITLDVSAGRTATLAVGISFIGIGQARRNLDHDIAQSGGGFDSIRAATRAAWAAVLGRLDVTGASDDQLTTLYSSLYRLHLYPNIAHEPYVDESRCDTDGPRWVYADPFEADPDDSDVRTGRRIVEGRLTVNDGFWDSYRASWPLRTFIAPRLTGQLLDGFVEHFRAGGWVSRWSAPGPADIMTGTSSDAVFADAVLAGVPGIDVEAAYDSCLRNATTPSADPHVGRKGLARSIFTGYTNTDTAEGMSWTVDAAINDAAIAAFSDVLAARHPEHPRHDEFRSNATWFAARAASYATVFDSDCGFFRGRRPGGSFRPANDFDPRDWGGDYTETTAWGAAFTAPHDGAGLAALYGGRDRLERKLDEFSALAETGRETHRGGYPVVIHEMREARDTRMGMLALSNQPAHHIPFMYAHTSRPGSLAHAKTQALIREATARLFLGSEAGQGYPGDEDNGEMSAWYLWAVSGLYPLAVGSGEFVITAPTFPALRWTLESGSVLTIEAPEASPANRYIRSVRIDGEFWTQITVPRGLLMRGATIRIDLGAEPSDWAQGSVPTSVTPIGAQPRPPKDLTTPAQAGLRAAGVLDAAAAFDDDSTTPSVALASGDVVGWRFDTSTRVDHYTVTVEQPGDHAWTVQGRTGDDDWCVLDRRQATFRWERQTRIFAIGQPASYADYRVQADTALHLAQLEYLNLRGSSPAR